MLPAGHKALWLTDSASSLPPFGMGTVCGDRGRLPASGRFGGSGRFAQDAQVAAAGALRGGGRLKSRVRCPLPRGLGRRTGGSLTDSISQREKVVGTRLRRLGRHGEAEY